MPLADMPQSNRQHAVPQNIMDVEFKLIGELTMRQFSYLLVFGLAAYFSFVSIPGLFKIPTTVFFALLALGLAFVPVQERGLDEWLVNFFRSINSPTERVWKRTPQLPTAFLYDSIAMVQQEMITLAPTSSRRKLEEYLKYKSDESASDPLDIPEREYIMKVREAYRDVAQPESVGVTVDYAKEDLVDLEPTQVEETFESLHPEALSPQMVEPPVPTEPSASTAVAQEVEIKEEGPALRIIKSKMSSAQSRPQPSSLDYHTYEMITPDMHSGRKFVNLVPSSGEIVLPIRGERVLNTSESVEIQEDIEEKAKKLEDLIEKIRREEGMPAIKTRSVEEPRGMKVDKEAKSMVEELERQNKDLVEEISKLKKQIEQGKSMSVDTIAQEELLKKLEAQKGDIASSYSELQSQVNELQKKLDEQVQVSTGKEFVDKMKTKLPVLTNRPNVVTGVVRDPEGKFLSDLLLTVKNSRGDTVRAFKTNALGQFVVSTPLQNGTYTLEVSPSNKTNFTFAIIPIEVKGEVMPAIGIVGK